MSGEYNSNIRPRPVSMDSTVSGLGGDTYNQSSSIEHERNIFMRAALQLLDKNDIKPGLVLPGGRVSSESGSNKCILRSGALKKASGNKLSNGGWKAKFVEIRHGEFVYEDDSTTWGDATKKKTISLVADRCRCRIVKKRSDPTIFELTEYGGIRRLWRADSQEERDAWVHSINAAMVGSAGDFEGDDAGVVFSPSPGKYSPKTSRINSSFSGLQKTSAKKAALTAEAALLTPYTEGIDIFTRTRERVYRSRSAEEYRALLDYFVKSHTPLVVPVGFAKNYGRRPELRRASSNIISNQTSQVWKDMCRDVIVINGERFTGIESIICGLVRVLVDCADRIRVLQVQRQQLDCPVDPDSFHFSKGASFRDSVLGLTGLGDSSLGLMFHEGDRCPLFDLNEGQLLACAKEILYACNRTHSGGDTYDSVNSMICHDTFAVLTPFDTEAEPMEIRVDVIQRENSRGVVHNAWLDKTLVPGSADTKVRAANSVTSDSEMTSKSQSGRILSPFRKLGGNKKSKKKDKRNSDPAVYNGATTPPTPLGLRGEIDGDESTPMGYGRNHKRTETTSTASSVRTPVQPYFARDYDENTSDEEGSHMKKHSGWHNPASCATDDLSQPLGIEEAECQRPKSTNLPPPTLTNVYRDKWGASFSSVPDESSLGSSNGGQTSVSSSDNGGAIRTRVKAMFSMRQKSTSSTRMNDARGKLDGSEVSEEDSKQAKSIAMTSASASSGAYSVPSLPLHNMGMDNNIPPSVPGRKVRLSEKSDESPVNSGAGVAAASEINTTPRRVVNVEDISTCGEEDHEAAADDVEISPTGVHTRFIKNSSQPNEISDRPMCVRVEVRAKSRYKICSMDPQGEGDDTWAAVTGIFQQLFYLKSFCNGKPSVSDKVVSIGFDPVSPSELP